MPLISGVAGDYPTQYGVLFTTTMQALRKNLIDVVSDGIPTWWFLNQNGRKKTQDGGESILQPLMYRLNAVQTFSGFDTLNTNISEGFTNAVFLWKKYHCPVVLSKDDLRANSGESRILSLLEAQVEQAKIAFQDKLNEHIVANNNTSGAGDPKGLDGLATIVTDPTGTTEVYGGIIQSTANSWWKCKEATSATNFATTGVDAMRDLYYSCTRGSDRPDLGLLTEATFKNYEKSQVDLKRYINTNAMDAGFENLAYHGMTLIFDREMPANTGFFLNTKYLNLIVDPEVEMFSTPWRDAMDQWAMFSRIFWRGNLTCSNRNRLGILNGTIDT